MRVFLDANVLFSAAYREAGPSRALFTLANAGHCVLVSSAHAIEEARRNLGAKNPGSLPDLERLIREVEVCAAPGAGTVAWAAGEGLPPNDAPILAAAIEARCNILATGHRKDFGALFGRRLRGMVVMLPVDAMGVLLGRR